MDRFNISRSGPVFALLAILKFNAKQKEPTCSAELYCTRIAGTLRLCLSIRRANARSFFWGWAW